MDGAHAKGKGIAVKAEAALCLILLVAAASAQPLDWMQDMTIFGTTADERCPALAIAPSSGIMRAVCILDDGVVASKISEDNGASWSAVSAWYAPSLSVLTASTADREHGYVCVTGEDRRSCGCSASRVVGMIGRPPARRRLPWIPRLGS